MNEDAAVSDQQDRESSFVRIRDELMGRSFSTAKELRHLAERCGFSFVPVEVVNVGETQAHMLLRPKGLGEVHLHADRIQHWHPFRIYAVEHTPPE